MSSNPTDRELLQRTAAGDAGAFSALARRHQSALYRFLSTVDDDDANVQDALQEAFVAAWRSAASFRGQGSVRAWLFAIGRNALRRLHRRRQGEPAVFDSLEELGARAGWGAGDDGSTELERLARRELLELALDALPAEERQVLTLRDLEGFSGAEAADALGISVPAMKSRLHRARLRFMGRLREMSDVTA